MTYRVPIIKAQEYTEKDILEKELYFLIPYYIMRYEHLKDDKILKQINQEYQKLYQGMMHARETGLLNEYDMSNIIDLLKSWWIIFLRKIPTQNRR